jgi:histidinol-phosphate aminotransferase
MENPYSWPSEVLDDWLSRIRDAKLNRYPDPASAKLRTALRSYYGVPAGSDIMIGNGSDEIIQILLAALKAGSTVMVPTPTFVMYQQIAACLELNFIGVPLKEEDFQLDINAFLEAIAQHDPSIIFLAYPNNPTGNLFDRDEINRIIKAARGLVIIDEAYGPFAESSFLSEVTAEGKLLVMGTLSKLGLAGLRLGFLVGAPEWIEQFNKIRLPYNINILSQLTAEFALERSDLFQSQVSCILRDRATLLNSLRQMQGIKAYDSHTNFILFKLSGHDANQVHASLRSAGILIKNLHGAGGPLAQCLRVTVGTPDENRKFLEALTSSLNQ